MPNIDSKNMKCLGPKQAQLINPFLYVINLPQMYYSPKIVCSELTYLFQQSIKLTVLPLFLRQYIRCSRTHKNTQSLHCTNRFFFCILFIILQDIVLLYFEEQFFEVLYWLIYSRHLNKTVCQFYYISFYYFRLIYKNLIVHAF